jgi:acetyl-CoA carboxylase alpha subunit
VLVVAPMSWGSNPTLALVLVVDVPAVLVRIGRGGSGGGDCCS